MSQILPIQSHQQHQLTEGLVSPAPSWGPPRQAEPEEEISAAAVIGMVRRHWLLILGIVALSLTAAYAKTRMTTPVYRASTTLYFADRQGSMPALDILNQMENGNDKVESEMEVMRSRALAGIVVDSLGMQAQIIDPPGAVTSRYLSVLRADPLAPNSSFQFSARKDGSFEVKNAESASRAGIASLGQPFTFGNVTAVLLPWASSSGSFKVRVQPRSAAVGALLAQLSVTRPNKTASVVQVSYTGHDRVETRNVPDVLATSYLAWRSNLRKSGDRSTVEFLRRQIDTISTQLYSAEESLRRFREANQVVDLPTQAQTQVQRLAALEAQRNDINMQRAALESLMADVKNAPTDPRLGSPYRRLMAFPGLMTIGNPAFPLLQTLTDLEQRRADLLVRRTANDPDVQSLAQAITSIENQIAAVVDTYLKGLNEQATSFARSVAEFHVQVDQVPRREIEYARLDRNATGLTQIYTMLQTRLREAQIAEAVDDGAVRVVDPAALPTLPIAPRPARNLLLGGLLGLLLAFAAVQLRERLDHTVHTKEEVEAISGAAVLALIPHIGEADRAKYFERWVRVRRNNIGRNNGRAVPGPENGSRLLLKDAQSVASEAFRKLRTNITFARPDSPPRVLIFTSPAAGDGKTTSVMNLAIALVQQGKRVIVVDGDMRRGGLHKLLKGAQTPGLSEILVGQTDFDSAVQSLALESFGTVDMLATGVIPPNPAELLASPRFRALIETLRLSYDAILIDSPPINLVTDAAIIGRETDGAVVVVRAAKTTRGELAHAIGQLRQVQVPVTGMILNDYNAKRDAGYNAAYYYGYSHDYRPYTGQA
jgi:tyrosine-protein kinase Etk/Wzc